MTSTTTKFIFITLFSTLLNGCTTVSPNYAPISTNHPDVTKDKTPSPNQTKYHQVKKGETLYAISLLFSLDYRKLAQWNQLAPPYRLEIGQNIKVSEPNTGSKPNSPVTGVDSPPKVHHTEILTAKPPAQKIDRRKESLHETQIETTENKVIAQQKTTNSLNILTVQPPYNSRTSNNSTEKNGISSQKKSIISIDNKSMLKLNFKWPIKGKVLKAFSKTGNKGIDIDGAFGQDVSAAETGKVVYSGQGLMGYGQLLIIKHNDVYLSAYANNSQLLVAEGYSVEKGQLIAKVGQAGSNKTSLHFEIRKDGKPVNPLNFLPKKH